MKKPKTTGKPAARGRSAGASGAKAKVQGRKVTRRTPAAAQPGQLLDGAVADLVAITEELRELVVELRALIRREEEEETEGEVTMVITEGEGPEDLE